MLRFFNTFEPVSSIYKDLLPHLAEAGIRSEVVISRHAYRSKEQPLQTDLIRFREVPTLAPWRFTGVRNLTTHISYGLLAAMYSITSASPVANVFLTQPPMFSGWGLLLQKLRRQAFCCIVMDLYPWVAAEAGVIRRDGVAMMVLSRLATATLTRAAAVITIGSCMADRVVQLGVPRDRVHIIRNWANTEVVRPVPPHENRLRGAWQLDDRFVVMYSGNMGVSHSFDELLRVARQLRKETEIVFLIVGGGRRLGQVRRYVEEHGLDNVRFQGFQPYARLAESLSAGDVHFISLRSGFEGLVVPSKAYGVLAAGRPIIYLGDPGGEIGRMVSTDNLGIVVAPGDVDGLRTAVLKAFQDARWRQSVGERARGAAEVRYSMARAMSAYAGVLATLNRRCGDDPSSS